jgi:hypothetical protein
MTSNRLKGKCEAEKPLKNPWILVGQSLEKPGKSQLQGVPAPAANAKRMAGMSSWELGWID